MRVLVVGGGGREAAIAWACRRHGHDVIVAPDLGEAGPADVDLVVPGPEAALAAGIADECAPARASRASGRPPNSPGSNRRSRYARSLATELGIPGPRFARFDGGGRAPSHGGANVGVPVVVKLDGLAGGKGVVVPDGDAATERAIDAAAATGPFLLEERMHGPECSLMALCDGTTAVALPIAQDHKRIGEGDTGPNTGGMGAYAPAPIPYAADELSPRSCSRCSTTSAPAGTPYVGVIYAGLMLHRRRSATRRVQRALRRSRRRRRCCRSSRPTWPTLMLACTRGPALDRAD